METNHSPTHILHLCDAVLINVFSYLDLYDRKYVLPKVCKRFDIISCLYLPKVNLNTSHKLLLLAKKWKTSENIKSFLRKIGPGLKTVKMSRPIVTIQQKKNFNLMLGKIRKYCCSLEKLEIGAVQNTKCFPISLKHLVIRQFSSNLLDLTDLKNLKNFRLKLTFRDIPGGIEWMQVKNRLEHLHLSLALRVMKNVSTFNQLLSIIAVKSSISLKLYNSRQSINYDFLSDPQNLTQLFTYGSSVGGNINKILNILATRNTVKVLVNYGSYSDTCILPIITPQTMDLFFQWTALSDLKINDSVVAYSLFFAYVTALCHGLVELSTTTPNGDFRTVQASKAK